MSTRPAWLPAPLWSSLLITLATLLTAVPGLLLAKYAQQPTAVWLSTGVAFALLIRFGPAYWPVVALTAAAVGIWGSEPVSMALLSATASALCLAAAAQALRRHGFNPAFRSQRDLWLFLLATMAAMLLAAAVNAVVLIGHGMMAAASWPMLVTLWWLTHATGAVLAAPVVLALTEPRWSQARHSRTAMLGWAALMLLTLWLLFFSEFGRTQSALLLLLLLPMPPLIWAALRLGFVGASLAILLLTLAAMLASALGSGPFDTLAGGHGQVVVWLYISVLALVGLMVAALQGERDQVEEKLRRSQALLDAIREAQSHFIADGGSSAFEGLLQALQELTRSRYAFIAETVPGEADVPALRTLALTAMDWTGTPPEDLERVAREGLLLDNPNNLFGAMLRSGERLISDRPQRDPRAGGLPPGHPALRKLMLLPLVYAGERVGIVALANRPGGYSDALAAELAPFLSTTAGLIAAYRAERERALAEQRQAEALERLQRVTALVPGTVYQFEIDGDGHGRFPFASAGIRAIYGVAPDDVRDDAQTVIDRLHPEDRDMVMDTIMASYRSGQTWRAEYRVRLPDGSEHWVQGQANPERQADGRVTWFGYIHDVTERRRAEEEQRIAAIAFESQEGLLVTDAQSRILRVNRAFSRITGFAADEVIGQTPSLFASGRHDDDFYRNMWEALARQHFWQGEIWNRRKDGEVYPQWLTISAVLGPTQQVTHYVASLSDITQRKQAEEQIRRLAFFDPLTALPNRRLLRQRLDVALRQTGEQGPGGALLFIDLDHFKTLNDTRGHDIGDQLLAEIALRLRHSLRDEDVVARLGGDEFVVLLARLDREPEAAVIQASQVASKLLEAVRAPLHLAGHEHHPTASIGISLFGPGDSSEDLLKRADLAMYAAKAGGRNAIRVYDPAMQDAIDSRAQLEIDLRRAIPGDQFQPLLQAQIDAEGELIGAELLLHWRHPQRGMVSPQQFIPLAEETGLIVPIGLWVIDYACGVLDQWQRLPAFRNARLAVNVSAVQFRQPDFVEQVAAILERHRIRADLLKLELTESLVLHDIDDAIAKMQALRRRGVGFAMDDFGTGQSSLASLKQLPLEQLKIDQSFVRDLETDPNDAIIVQTIIGMAASLGLGVIAEGVESEAQLDFLRQHGCSAFQGFLIGRPLPRERFEIEALDRTPLAAIGRTH